MGTVAALGPGVDEFDIGDRVTVEIHAGCGQCKRCRQGMYTSCHNYGLNYGDVDKGHRANGFTTDGGFAEYAVNNINTVIKVPDDMSDEEATLVVTAGTSMYGLTSAIQNFFLDSGPSPYVILALMVLVWFLLGMVIDSISIMLLTVPIFEPLAAALGLDRISFAVVGILAIEAGLLTPPFGLLVYTVKAAIEDPDVGVREIFRYSIPYWIIMLIGIVSIVALPGIANYLPNQLF